LGEDLEEELADDPVGDANGVPGLFLGLLCILLWSELGEVLLESSSSSLSEDGTGIGSCTETWSEGLGAGSAMICGFAGNEDSSKVTSVDTLIVRVFLSQSLYPFELGSYLTKIISRDCDLNL